MAAQRYYYSDSITDFLSRSTNEIVGDLTLASQHDINDETAQSWVEEIDTLREALEAYSGRGSLYFEYNIPRMGRRADVIVLIDGWNTKQLSSDSHAKRWCRCGTMHLILRTFRKGVWTEF